MASIRIEHLTFTYPLSTQPALRDLSLSVQEGEFLLLCGESGCGKTTLLRHLKTAFTPHGVRSGEILLDGQPIETLSARDQAGRIGFVLQQPEDQIVTDKVWHELAFGPENLGVAPEVLRRRVGEMASFFGIQEWFDRDTDALSGGQKQMLNLASVLVMQPEVLILDEPTARLDPIAAAEFLRAVERVNRELGVTVLLSEQRLELALGMADRAVVLHQGEIAACGTPEELARRLYETHSPFFAAMPAAVRIWGGLGAPGGCPMDVRGGKALLRLCAPAETHFPAPEAPSGKPLLQLKDVWFRYEKNADGTCGRDSRRSGRQRLRQDHGPAAAGRDAPAPAGQDRAAERPRLHAAPGASGAVHPARSAAGAGGGRKLSRTRRDAGAGRPAGSGSRRSLRR